MKRIFYISGPMTFRKDTDWNFPAFYSAAKFLQDNGWQTLNPADNAGGDTTHPRAVYMRLDIESVLKATDVYCLPGWTWSLGAVVEVIVARQVGIPIWQADVTAIGYMVPAPECPAERALKAICHSMAEGERKHPAGSWRVEPITNHSGKGARHLLTGQLILDGNQKDDGEEHWINAVTRAAMALTVFDERHNPNGH